MIKKVKKKNRGNSFIMVVATLSFLAVLVAAILVAVALSYKLKALDINSRDNFYVLEQAMDEIYAGVGADSIKHLNKAYDDTIEVLVYYDTVSQSYITMKNEQANELMKKTFIRLVKEDKNYATATDVLGHLNSFLSNKYDASSNEEGVQLSVGNLVSDDASVKVMNLLLKREAEYSTRNTRKTKKIDKQTFVQSITTDLVICQPEFDVNFNTVGQDMADLYDFTIVADMGMEVVGAASNVNVTGDVYAAADFYNKDYNITNAKDPNYLNKDNENAIKYAKVNSYDKNKLKKCNGVYSNSMYSGIFVDAGTLKLTSNRIIVPGTIAAMNCGEINITHYNPEVFTDVWADGLALGGYSLKNPDPKVPIQGAKMDIRGNLYISDDLELNATASDFKMNGEYYGYNYASLDNRNYTKACVNANGGRTFSDDTPDTIKDGASLEGQAHYNSSAIIVNGQDSILDLKHVSNMYIAGQSYIELSKQTTTHDKKQKLDSNGYPMTDQNGNPQYEDFKVENKDGQLVSTTYDTYEYKAKTENEDDYYTTNNNNDKTNIQDYRTGEAISVKSNQLAYLAPIPNSWITDNDKGLYLTINEKFYNDAEFLKENWDDLSKIPVIKSVISGKKYYFFDFSRSKENKGKMNEFIASYANLFDDVENGLSKGEKYGLTDITNYDHFKVKKLELNLDEKQEIDGIDKGKKKSTSIYSNSAITVKDGTSLVIKSRSDSLIPLVTAAQKINEAIAEQNSGGASGASGGYVNGNENNGLKLSNDVTTKLQSQYKEVKWLLTNKSHSYNAITDAHAMKESDITPINYFFNFNLLNKTENFMLDDSRVILSDEDVFVEDKFAKDGVLKGLILCKGDVTFDKNIKSFQGLIVCGGKVKINHTIEFAANEEIVKSILRKCDESQAKTGRENHFNVCELFLHYKPLYKPKAEGEDVEKESMKEITAIQFEDILGFENWKKNVD